jgi:hypothetical protein
MLTTFNQRNDIITASFFPPQNGGQFLELVKEKIGQIDKEADSG